jgi:hypothetical protein
MVRVSVRRIKNAMASACPWRDAFELAHVRLRSAIACYDPDSAQSPCCPANAAEIAAGA